MPTSTPRSSVRIASLAAALALGPPAGAETTWKTTETHRIKIKTEGGREVGEWHFPRKGALMPDGKPAPSITILYEDTPQGRMRIRKVNGNVVSRRRVAEAPPAPIQKAQERPAGAPSPFPELDQQAKALAAKARAIQDTSGDPLEFATVLVQLADLHTRREDLKSAEATFLQVLAIYEDHDLGRHPQAADTHTGIARVYGLQERPDLAREHLANAFELHFDFYGKNHPAVGNVLYLMGLLEHQEGKLADAERLYVQALEVFFAARKPDHRACLQTHRYYARLLESQGRRYEALSVKERALAIAAGRYVGPGGPGTQVPKFDLDEPDSGLGY